MGAILQASLVSFKAAASGVSTSYANPLGSGDRTAAIIVTEQGVMSLLGETAMESLVDGVQSDGQYFINNVSLDSTKWVKFDLGAAKVIDEAKWYQSDEQDCGVWRWMGSNDNSAWTNVGATFSLGVGGPTQTHTSLNGNTTAYRYWRLTGVAETTSWNQYIREVEFKVEA